MPNPSSGVNLEVVLERLEDSVFRSGRKIELNLKSSVLTQGQEDRVERILGHLVQNALDATDSGGHVQLSLNKVANQAEIILCDTGHGMTPEFVSKSLFKPFQTTKQNGMGIGAYECFLYIQELCGSINVESKQGVGTTITIMLPLFESIASGVNHGLELT
jgi:signal transduction histidine kinase